MDVSLKGRSAIITGGSKGIGFAIAKRFAADGSDVAIVARGREALDAAVSEIKAGTNSHVLGVQADVGKADDVQRAYDEAMAAFGKLDIAVNNAGTSRAGPFEAMSDAVLQDDLELKLFAAVRISRLVLPQMKERRWGRIINVLNIGAKAPRAASGPTSITRAAGMAFTKALASEYAPFNILVNGLLVGLIDADQHVQKAKSRGISLDEYKAGLAKDVPLGRFGRAEEFANIACFLASDAGSYITGTAINVDGGRSPVV
ncbi:MAG: 3-oxoacyl-[acyl-carrier protein] reductase [Hyphomicrobiales bacterium]|nr:3-oxoacyl-[acyl-carrier protein] reductase [Hyphomicrobiales bacterium]